MATASLVVRVRTAGTATLAATRRQFRRLRTEVERLHRRHMPALQRSMTAAGATAARLATGAVTSLLNGLNNLAPAILSGTASFAKMTAIVLALGSAIVPLVVTIGNLLPLLMMLGPPIVAAGLAFAALKFAFEGVGSALKAGLSGDVDEFKKSLKKLAPSAREAVKELVKLAPAWRGIKRETQQAFWRDSARDIRALSGLFEPLVRKSLPAIALGFARARYEFTAFLTSERGAREMGFIFTHITQGINGFQRALAPLGAALVDMLAVAAPKFNRLGEYVANLAERFAAFIASAKDSGKLQGWLDGAIATFEQLKRIIGNIGASLGAIFSSGQESGQSFLDTLERLTAGLARWLNTERGEKFIEMLGWIANALLNQLGVIATLANAYATFSNFMRKIWANILETVLNAMLLMLQGATGAFGWIPGIGAKLEKAKKDFENFSNGVIAALRGIPDENVNLNVNVRYRDPGGGRNVRIPDNYEGLGGRPSGGPVMAGRSYWVGEHGKELVTFGAQARVHSASESARMATGGASGGMPPSGVGLRVSGAADSAVAALLRQLFRTGHITATTDAAGRVTLN